MRIAIVGSRSFDQYGKLESFIFNKLTLSQITEVISGGARGADALGALFAEIHNIPLRIFPAKWDEYGKKAGYIRNVEIVDNSDIVFAFWDGKSRGTGHTINLAEDNRKPVHICYF